MALASSTIALHDAQGQSTGTVPVPAGFTGPVDKAILWQAVRMYLANQRQGTADTKTRGEVQGGGKKPWKQKHTGRARAGSIRSPIWRKGGIVFGPHPREYRYDLPKILRQRALVESLKAKLQAGELIAVEGLDALEPKTRLLGRLLAKLGAVPKALVVMDRPHPVLARISRNLPGVWVKPVSDLNCYDVLRSGKLVVTSAALKQIGGLQG
jgi:large subunit ribosomal protein L4